MSTASVKATIKAKERLKQQVSWVIWGIALTLTAVFGWLQSKGIDLVGFITSVPAHAILQGAVAVYFASWCTGLPSDTNTQLSVYVDAPHRGTLFSRDSIFIIVMLIVVFSLLCWAQSSIWFAALLLLFLMGDIGGRCYLLYTIRPTIAKSDSHYKATSPGEYAKLESLKKVDAYLSGAWIWVRYGVGLALLVVLGVFMFVPPFIEKLQESSGLSGDMLLAIAVMCYVLIMEGWQWHKRFQLWNYTSLLEEIDEGYTLAPRPQPTTPV